MSIYVGYAKGGSKEHYTFNVSHQTSDIPKLFWPTNFLQNIFRRPNFEHCAHHVSMFTLGT